MSRQQCFTKFVVDGEAAERVYKIIEESHFVKSNNELGFNTQIEFDYANGVLRIEERTDAHSLVDEVLCFFVGYDNYYSLAEQSKNGEVQYYEVHDDEGKYFVHSSKTEWEKQQEELESQPIDLDNLLF